MLKAIAPAAPRTFSLAWILLCVLLLVMQAAGGASRADALGQVVVRGAAWLLLIIAILFCGRPDARGGGPVVLLFAAACVLLLLQLIPLPPSIWAVLPGRDVITHASAVAGEPQVWRPWSIVPAATLNALFSLVVPATTLWLALCLREEERGRLTGVLLFLAFASAVVGLIQGSSLAFDNPLINETVGTVSGVFANRNHFALQMAIGCVLALAWGFGQASGRSSRGIIGIGLALLFLLSILVSGSRMGALLGSLGLATGFLLSLSGIRCALARYPGWAFTALVSTAAVSIIGLVLLGASAGRARSIDRLFAVDPGQDMRTRGLSTVMSAAREYFPAGSGVGGFDPIFRLHEPFGLLKPTYFNHAHNDFMEVAVDAGLPGLVLLAATLCWWGWASIKAWRAGSARQAVRAKMGSALLLLLIVASLVDYPARTPVIMAWAMIAAIWLSQGTQSKALPDDA